MSYQQVPINNVLRLFHLSQCRLLFYAKVIQSMWSWSPLPSATHFSLWKFLSFLGTYIYIETSGLNRRLGEKARLESEIFQATNGKCFSFWYHMYGQDIGTLKVYIKDAVSEKLLQTYNGSQGNLWKEGEVGLYSRTNFKVTIKLPRSFFYRYPPCNSSLYAIFRNFMQWLILRILIVCKLSRNI